MQYKKFPISAAKFLRDGTEVLIGSQYYGHCHSYNLISGKTYKMLLPHGITNMQVFKIKILFNFILILIIKNKIDKLII